MPVDENEVLRVSCRNLYLGTDEVVNVLHFVCLTNMTADDTELGNELATGIASIYSTVENMIDSGITPNVIDIYNVDQDYPLGQFSWGPDWHGGDGAGDPLPSGVAAMVIWNTNTKRLQGKTYLGVATEAALSGGGWSGTAQTYLEEFATDMLTDIEGASGSTYRFGIYSRTQGIFRHPTGFRIPATPAYQRRRKLGHGS